MEETQLLWDPDQRDPRGRLRILTGGQQAESALDQFMVYEGLNVIGRDENCHIHIPVQSVSRRHAVIEVEGDSHVIRDCDSLNSTWRKKVFLKPHVRYDINDGDLFLFGDVACQYQVLPPAAQGSDSGSETGSESVLPQIGAGEGAESDPIAQAGNSDAELTGDSLVVSPTPAHQRSRLPAQVAQPDVHVKESEDDDTPWKGSRSLFSRPCQDPSTSVCQTPSANIVPESDDEAENVSRSSAEPTRLHYGSDTDLEEDQHPGEESAEQSTEQPADGIDPLPEAAVNGDTALGDLSAAEDGASSEPGDRVVQENGDLPSQRPVTPPSADTGDSYALEPTQCFILNVSSSQDETLAEENCITPGDPVNTHSPEEDDTQTFDLQSPPFSKEPSQSDPVVRTSGTESVAEPSVSEAAETVLPPHRGGSEPREEGGPGPEDQELWANEETQLFCTEQRANGEEEEEEERAGNADRRPVPPSPDSPPGTEGGSVAEPPASPGPSTAADGGERGTISPEHGDVVIPATAEASPPGLETEADTREPGPETPATGQAAGRRGRGRLQRSETRQPAETSPAQTPTGPRRGNCRQQTSPQPTASDHPHPLEESPQPAAKGKAKHRTVASPQGAAEVPPETPSPSQQRTWGRSRRKLVNKEPSQSDPVMRTSGTESVAEPPVGEAAETVLPPHRVGSEPREEGGPGPEDQEGWANEETQLFCTEQRANGEEEEERAGNADRRPVPPSPDSPPGTEGGSVAEPPASPGPSAAADGGERGTISPEHGDVVNPATAEASPPGLGAEADTREPETPGPGRAAGRRGRGRLQRRETRQPAETSPGGAEVALETQSPSQKRTRGRSRRKQECTQTCLQETEMPCGQLPDAGDASAPPQMKTRRRTCQPSPSSSLASLSESPAASKRSETTTVQTPARPRRGNCRQQTSPQPTASDHPRLLEESPQLAARGKAKRRTAASPPGGAEVPPETPSPSQQRTRGRSRRKQECTQPSSQEKDTAAGRLRSSGAGSQPDSEKDASAPPQMKTRRQTCQPSPSSSLATLSESPTAPKVMFTGLVDEEGMEVIRQLGGEVVESVYDSTHLVANRIRRTVKFMCAVARGIPVVTSEWLKQSGKNRYYLSPRSFLLGDREQEQKFNFSLRDAIHKAKEQRLLQDYRIHVTPGVQPDPSQMATILQCCGATVLPKMPRANKEKTLVISCPSDLPKCKAALNANIPVVGVEFALTGILQQAVDLGKYRLDGDEVSHGQPQGKGRRLQSPEAPVTGGKRKKR